MKRKRLLPAPPPTPEGYVWAHSKSRGMVLVEIGRLEKVYQLRMALDVQPYWHEDQSYFWRKSRGCIRNR